MNKLAILLSSFAVLVAVFSACKKEPVDIYEYKAEVVYPLNNDKNLGDTMHIHVEFKSLKGQRIHNINVQIYDKANPSTVIYNKPTMGHIHADSLYVYEDDFVLSTANGLVGHHEWVLVAKVWGEEAGQSEKKDSVTFHVHP